MSAPPPPPPPPPPPAALKIKAPSTAAPKAASSAPPKRIEKSDKQLDFLEQLKLRQKKLGGDEHVVEAIGGQEGFKSNDAPKSNTPAPTAKVQAPKAPEPPRPQMDFMSVMKSKPATTTTTSTPPPKVIGGEAPSFAKNLKKPSTAPPPKTTNFNTVSNELQNKLKKRQIANNELMESLDKPEVRDKPKTLQMEEEKKKKEEEERRKREEQEEKVRREREEKRKVELAALDSKKADELRQKQIEDDKRQAQLDEEIRKKAEEKKKQEEEEARKKKEQEEKQKLEQQQKERADAFAKKKKIEPSNAAMDHFKQGNAAFQKADYPSAIQSYTSAIGASPDFARAYLFRGIAQMNSKKTSEAMTDFSKCLELVEFDDLEKEQATRALTLRGKCFKTTNKLQDAIRDLSRALELSTPAVQAAIYLERGICNDYLDNFDPAISDYDKFFEFASGANPKVSSFQYYQGYHNRASAYFQLKNYDNAKKDFSKAIEYIVQLQSEGNQDSQKDNFADTYYKRARCNEYLGQDQASLDDYLQVLKLQNGHQRAYYQIANVYFRLNQYQEALEHFNTVIKLDENDFISVFNRGMCHKNLGDFKSAQNDFNQVQSVNPNYYRAYIQCARTLRLEQDKIQDSATQDDTLNNEILEQYTQAIESVKAQKEDLTPILSNLYFERGTMNNRLKKFDDSIADFSKAIELDSLFVDAYYNRGVVYHHEKKDLKSALADYNRVLEFSPDDIECLLSRGMVLYNSDQVQEALADWNKVLELDSGHEMAKKYVDIASS